LESCGVVFARREAQWLLESATGVSRMQMVAEDPLVDLDAARKLDGLVERRMTGEPLQYVIGVAPFRHLELSVGPGVFIPRPETEIVTELAMSRLPRRGTVVDVGTGSGAIALAIADERRDARVWATEVSPDALAWARKNRDALGFEVGLVEGDLFDGLPASLERRVDVVVANPPYGPERDRAFLPVDVVAHEPAGALFGSDDGLSVITRIAAAARPWLTRRGWLVLEVGARQASDVMDILRSFGYREVGSRLDLAGCERVVEARM
jgi:release factor glutamine methyltransferase